MNRAVITATAITGLLVQGGCIKAWTYMACMRSTRLQPQLQRTSLLHLPFQTTECSSLHLEHQPNVGRKLDTATRTLQRLHVHGAHPVAIDVAPVTTPYVPTGQLVHSDAPGEGEYKPVAHCRQLLALATPVTLLNVPLGHKLQFALDRAPTMTPYDPDMPTTARRRKGAYNIIFYCYQSTDSTASTNTAHFRGIDLHCT